MSSTLRGHETNKGATHTFCADVLLSPLSVYLCWTFGLTSIPHSLSALWTATGLVPRELDLTFTVTSLSFCKEPRGVLGGEKSNQFCNIIRGKWGNNIKCATVMEKKVYLE